MSLKGIELQIAIPKTVDAGKLAEQKQQRSQISQDLAHAQTEKQAVKNKETVLETEKYTKMNPNSKDENQSEQNEEDRAKKEEEEKNTRHPYKGSFVDFSG